MYSLAILPLCLSLCTLATTCSFVDSCLSLVPEASFPNSSRTVLEYVQAGTNVTFPDKDITCNRSSQVVSKSFCRIGLSIPTSNRSSISSELWLPAEWNGRFLATGNGGIDGCIKYEDLVYTTQNGFVSIGSNNGHNGSTLKALFHNADVTTDHAWRALHTITEVGKSLTKLFYGQKHTKSYYIGCSFGGRQGMKAADMFPQDFDGIVAGSPAVDFNNLQSWRANFFPITGPPNSSTFISKALWQTIHDEVLKQCDDLDGATDGIIEDPNLCHFRPEILACEEGNGTDCLSPSQIDTVKRIFSPLFGQNGNLIYAAMQPGSEVMAAEKLYAGEPFNYSEEWFKYVVNGPDFDAARFNLMDVQAAEDLNPANIRTWPSSLAQFRDTGGKMISYHGGQDQQITSFNTERFYKYLQQGMSATSSDLDSFFRFFRVPGMGHCNSGPGAWVIGQGGGPSAAGVPFTSDKNVLAALVSWVENGTAPADIIGTKFVNDTVKLGMDYYHRHCRYPLRSAFTGGDPKQLSSWQCQ